MKGLGKAEFYLGYQIKRNREAKTLTLDQHICAETMAKRFNVTKTIVIPTVQGAKPLRSSAV